jgi:hypothetical protein
MNQIKTWQQGHFIDSVRYNPQPQHWKAEQERIEQCLIRPSPKENAICKATTAEDAKWIAKRLNLASELEELVYNFTTGKIDEDVIVQYVKQHLDNDNKRMERTYARRACPGKK